LRLKGGEATPAMKIKIKLYGHLYWYTYKKKEIEIQAQQKSIESILNELNIPVGEIAMVTINKNKAELNALPQAGDLVEIYPVIGGG
jgi:sulfur carrier protein ThiS